ncbi:hypothetical protein MNV49_003484 [Pseudohyphozyma bogoriensis]|nr:hypothetical protein MNV49_003484 [Pseudohyphozyma bogoriensis]
MSGFLSAGIPRDIYNRRTQAAPNEFRDSVPPCTRCATLGFPCKMWVTGAPHWGRKCWECYRLKAKCSAAEVVSTGGKPASATATPSTSPSGKPKRKAEVEVGSRRSSRIKFNLSDEEASEGSPGVASDVALMLARLRTASKELGNFATSSGPSPFAKLAASEIRNAVFLSDAGLIPFAVEFTKGNDPSIAPDFSINPWRVEIQHTLGELGKRIAASLEKKLEKAKSEAGGGEDAIATLKDQIRGLQAQVKKRVAELDATIARRDATIAARDGTIAERDKEIASLRQQITSLEEEAEAGVKASAGEDEEEEEEEDVEADGEEKVEVDLSE